MIESREAWRRVPLAWEEFALSPSGTLMIGYEIPGTSTSVEHPIAEIVVAESYPTVAVTLFRRVLVLDPDDGASDLAEVASALPSAVQIDLREPLGDRILVDGSTGRRGTRRAEVLDRPAPRWLTT